MPQTLVSQLQPPVKGLNFRTPSIKLDPQEALRLDNIFPLPFSAELRPGYKDYVTNIPGSVVTLAPYIGNLPAESKVFAFNDQGKIYDATVSTDSPQEITSTLQIDGVWDYANAQAGNNNYLIIVSPAGGYWTYRPTEGFVKRELTGDAAGKTFSAVFSWKNRVWLIENNSTKAYYLDVGAIQGDAAAFDFGPVMHQGGYLSYGSNWTFNAGYDIDDYLVLVTTSGEVIVYKGYDPSSVDSFSLQGVWNIGKTPQGNKCFVQFGGELFVMSALGVVPVSKLVNGGVANDYQVMSASVSPVLLEVFNTYSSLPGWELDVVFNQSFLMLKTPIDASGVYRFWVMNIQTGAWATISNMPMVCAVQVQEKLFFGTTDGKVCRGFIGDTDGADLNGDGGQPVIGTHIGGYNDYGIPTNLKTWSMIRPIFLANDAPSVSMTMLTEYAGIAPSLNVSQPNETDLPAGRFDIDRWNLCTWSGSMNTYTSWIGLNGLGYYGAVSMMFTGPAGTQYIASNVTLMQGGVM